VNWSEDVATTYLWKNLLEKKGYHVTTTSLQAGELFTGLSEGGLDVFFDTWLPVTHKAYMKKYGANLTDLGKWYQGSTEEGFVVPKYVTNVNSISDLKSHASEFGGQIIGIDPGAGEMGLAQKAMTKYGLSNINLVQSSSPAMLSELAKDYKQKKPVVVTLWSPHWAFTKYKLKYLKDPKNVFGKSGWIQTEANKKWASSNPDVANMLKKFAGAKTWIKANQSLVNTWLG